MWFYINEYYMYSSKVGDRDDQFHCNDYRHLDNVHVMAFERKLFH